MLESKDKSNDDTVKETKENNTKLMEEEFYDIDKLFEGNYPRKCENDTINHAYIKDRVEIKTNAFEGRITKEK